MEEDKIKNGAKHISTTYQTELTSEKNQKMIFMLAKTL